MEHISTLVAVINTLNRVKTDNSEGNWDRIKACQNAIQQVIDSLKSEPKVEIEEVTE